MKIFMRKLSLNISRTEAEIVLRNANARTLECRFSKDSFLIFHPKRTIKGLSFVKVTGTFAQNDSALEISMQVHPDPIFSVLALLCSFFSVFGLISLIGSTEGWAVKVSLSAAAVFLILAYTGEYTSVLDLLSHKLENPSANND